MKKMVLQELDVDSQCSDAADFSGKLGARVIGQERAVRRLTEMYQMYLAGLTPPGRPIGNLLFLGPTGSGKTRTVEAMAEVLFGDSDAVVKVDCAEYQHSHEIAKLIGSPPGYIGHKETNALLTQERLNKFHNEKAQVSLVLFDEIEKASDSLWQLLLGILDKATLRLGDNTVVDFSKTIIFMTSNLGAQEMIDLISGGIGFAPISPSLDSDVDQKIYRVALEAARRKFSPEFMNRIDKVVVFRTLKKAHLENILQIELNKIQERLVRGKKENQFVFKCTEAAEKFLLAEGTDAKYGARHLKRSLERFLVYPMANLIVTRQLELGDLLVVDYDPVRAKMTFSKQAEGALIRRSA